MDIQKYIVSGVIGLLALAGGYFFLGGLLQGLITGVIVFLIVLIAYSIVLSRREVNEEAERGGKGQMGGDEFLLN